jgi:hypothetical protein
MLSKLIVMLDAEGNEREVRVPARYVICTHCRGTGMSSSHLGAFTRDEMDEQGPEFLEDYMAGVYDKPCHECEGGKVLLVDRAAIEARGTQAQRAALAWQDEDDSECAAERRCIAMESGCYSH